MSEKTPFDNEMIETIMKILRRGNSAELKKENGSIVVVEIKRQKKIKKNFTIG